MRATEHACALADAGLGLSNISDAAGAINVAAQAVLPRIADVVSVTLFRNDRAGSEDYLLLGRSPEHEAMGRAMRAALPVTQDHPVAIAWRDGRCRRYRLDAERMRALGAPPDAVERVRKLCVRSYLVAPLVHRARTFGVMSLTGSGRHFDRIDMVFAEELARRMAVALENAELYREATRSAERTTRLQQATAELAAANDSREVAATIVRQGEKLGAVSGVMALVDSSQQALVLHESYEASPAEGTRWQRQALTDRTPMVDAFARGVVVLVETIEQSRARYPEAAAQPFGPEGARVAMPIHAGDRVVGTVAFAFEGNRAFDVDDYAFYDTLARQCSMAFERSCAFAAAKEREEQLQAADRRKDEFLAMLAHELRNPLASVKLAVQMLRADHLGPERVERYHALLDRQTSHFTRLIDDLLEVSRITRGLIELRRESVDLRAVVTRAHDSLCPCDVPCDRNITLAIGDQPVCVNGDAVRLEQIVTNVLSNALRYTDVGATIEVSLTREGERARLRVRDTGIGIPPEKLDQVFELFAQADESLARTRGGLGIGLTIVRRLVELHGGSVVARSEGRGHGTEIEIDLPALLEARVAPPRQAPISGAKRHLRVLVVDDNEDARQTLADAVADGGHEVAVASDGRSAIAAAARVAPELVLLDIGLPDIDGYEVARRLRAAHPAATLVAVTGYGQARDRERAIEAGFDAHLVKPIDLDAVTAVLAGQQHQEAQHDRSLATTAPA